MCTILDHPKYKHAPKGSTISCYPTIVDVVDAILSKVEKDLGAIIINPLHPIGAMAVNGKFMACRVNDNQDSEICFIPSSPAGAEYFRGQSAFYDPCHSSFDRLKGQGKLQLLAHLHTSELKILLDSHPIIQEMQRCKIHIPFEGLAQHYGIPTSFLDVTNDIWTAAFFAATKYVTEEDHFEPITDENKFGVLYYTKKSESLNPQIEVIGLNYFNRPGKQSGFAFKMKRQRNLNNDKSFAKIFFRHDKRANQRIFDMNAEGRRLFPADQLYEYVKGIKNSPCSSIQAVELCRYTYYPGIKRADFINLCRHYGISIVNMPQITFSTSKIQQDWDEWCREGRMRFNSMISSLIVSRF